MAFKLNIKKHLLTGVSFMIPVVVASGLCMAIAKLIGGAFVGDQVDTLPWFINTLGGTGMSMVVPVLCAGISYSIADKPGIAPGLILGLVCVNIKAGFLGGMFAGFFVGYLVIAIRNYLKLPKAMKGLLPILFIPLLATLIVGVIFYLFIGTPIAYAQAYIISLMNSMMGGSRMVLGGIIGGMMGFDLGGPINKTASLFCNAMMAQGIYGPEAAKIVSGMVPPIGVALSVFVSRRKRYTPAEIEAAKAAFPLGLCFITEGVLPFAATDPIRVIFASMVGSATAAGLTMFWGVESIVPHGGIFALPAIEKPHLFIVALIIGSLLTAMILSLIKPVLKDGGDGTSDADQEEVEIDDFEIRIQ